MGMYTAIYGRITLKHDIAKKLYRVGEDGPHWARLASCRAISAHPDVKIFVNDGRRDFIGRGTSAYFNYSVIEDDEWLVLLENAVKEGWSPQPDWCDPDYVNTYSMRHYNPHTCEWTFFGSLKNYDDTIKRFVRILPLIATDWLLFEEYEELDENEKPFRHSPKTS